ncbi:MAG: DUF2840 domain-containing protein [Rhizobiales bacterium]|nr:DUF2840 domain-containing protein [Hyphomicrobiales bacterium]
MSQYYTRVHLHFHRKNLNYYIRFGECVFREEFTRREAYEYFPTGEIFCYIRWEKGQFGTKNWHVMVLRAGDETTLMHSIEGIEPGAEVLLDISGSERVYRVFKAIDQIERLKIDCAEVAPWYWIQSHARLYAALDPLVYSEKKHQAWLLEREVKCEKFR